MILSSPHQDGPSLIDLVCWSGQEIMVGRGPQLDWAVVAVQKIVECSQISKAALFLERAVTRHK
jgi:hypothetical protein